MSDFDDEKMEQGVLCKTGREKSDIRTSLYKEQSGRGTELDDPVWIMKKQAQKNSKTQVEIDLSHELSRHHQVEKSKAAATRNSGGIAGGWVLD